MKSVKLAHKLIAVAALLTCLIVIFIYWRSQSNSNETTLIRDAHLPSLNRDLLIVSQSSPFKDSLSERVSTHYKAVGVTVVKIDIAALSSSTISEFDAILVIHRWEARAPAETVTTFLDKNSNMKAKIVVMTTSWNGLEKMKHVDAITAASVVEDVRLVTDKIIKRLDPILRKQD